MHAACQGHDDRLIVDIRITKRLLLYFTYLHNEDPYSDCNVLFISCFSFLAMRR